MAGLLLKNKTNARGRAESLKQIILLSIGSQATERG